MSQSEMGFSLSSEENRCKKWATSVMFVCDCVSEKQPNRKSAEILLPSRRWGPCKKKTDGALLFLGARMHFQFCWWKGKVDCDDVLLFFFTIIPNSLVIRVKKYLIFLLLLLRCNVAKVCRDWQIWPGCCQLVTSKGFGCPKQLDESVVAEHVVPLLFHWAIHLGFLCKSASNFNKECSLWL